MSLKLRRDVWVESPQYRGYLKSYFLLPSPRSQVTLTQVLQTQDRLWATLSNPNAAMQELAGETLLVPHGSHQPPGKPGKGWG